MVRRKTSEYLLYAENLQKKLSTMNSVKTDAAASSSHQVLGTYMALRATYIGLTK